MINRLKCIYRTINSKKTCIQQDCIRINTSPLTVCSTFIIQASLSVNLLNLIYSLFLGKLIDIHDSIDSIILISIDKCIHNI